MNTKEEKRQTLYDNLCQFTGTTQYYSYPLFGIKGLLSDGIHYLLNIAECYWLIDAILSHQLNPVISKHPELKSLQFWRLNVNDDNSALLQCEWDKDEIVESQKIDYTNFPLDSITLYCSPTPEGYVIYLPSEY